MAKGKAGGYLLLGRVVDKGNALLDVALEALDGGLEERLLLVSNAVKNIDGLLSTVGLCVVSMSTETSDGLAYSELNGDGEEVDASGFLDLLAAGNTGEVDVAGLNKALGALGSFEELLGKPDKC